MAAPRLLERMKLLNQKGLVLKLSVQCYKNNLTYACLQFTETSRKLNRPIYLRDILRFIYALSVIRPIYKIKTDVGLGGWNYVHKEQRIGYQCQN